jgi:hypothetical protein
VTLQLDKPNPGGPDRSGPPPNYNTMLIAVAVVASLVLVALAVALVLRSDRGDGGFELGDSTTTGVTEQTSAAEPPGTDTTTSDSTESTTDSSAATSSTSASTTDPSTSTSIASSTTTDSTDSQPGTPQGASVVWPDPGGESGFDTPEEAARSFAVDLVGYREPLFGDFRAGDGRSGEIEVRPASTGPITTVLLRQVGSDDSWSVIGAVSDDIVVDRPVAGASVSGELQLDGRALAFEGQVDVVLLLHGEDEPAVEGFVTGRGDGVLGEFSKRFPLPGGASGPGVLLLIAPSAEDGSAWAVTALPIQVG